MVRPRGIRLRPMDFHPILAPYWYCKMLVKKTEGLTSTTSNKGLKSFLFLIFVLI